MYLTVKNSYLLRLEKLSSFLGLKITTWFPICISSLLAKVFPIIIDSFPRILLSKELNKSILKKSLIGYALITILWVSFFDFNKATFSRYGIVSLANGRLSSSWLISSSNKWFIVLYPFKFDNFFEISDSKPSIELITIFNEATPRDKLTIVMRFVKRKT